MATTAESAAIQAAIQSATAELRALLVEALTELATVKAHLAKVIGNLAAEGAVAAAKPPRGKKQVAKDAPAVAPTVAMGLDGSAGEPPVAAEEKKDDEKKKAKSKMTKPVYIKANWNTEPLNAAIQKALTEAEYAAATASGTDAEKATALCKALGQKGQKVVLAGIPEFSS